MSSTGMGGPGNGQPGQGSGGQQQPWQQRPSSDGADPEATRRTHDPDATHIAGDREATRVTNDPDATHLHGTPPANRQFGTPQQGSPAGPPQGGQHGYAPQQPQHGFPAQGAQYGPPQQHPQFAAPGNPGSPPGPGGPGFPGGPVSPSGPGQPPARKRPWVLILVALGCAAMLVLVLSGGILFFALNRGGEEPPAASTPPAGTVTDSEGGGTALSTDPADSEFEVIHQIDEPPGDADDLRGVMANNPLTTGTLPDVSTCELPETPVEQSTQELQAVLSAAGSCLNDVWTSATADRGLPWVSPTIQVYTYPDIPNSPCKPESFEKDFPRVCNLDGIIYWPAGYGTGATQSDPAVVPGAYLWDLAYLYMNPVVWNSSLVAYYAALTDQLEGDQEQLDDASRRYYLQMFCIGAASTMQQPTEAQPAPELREKLLDESSWEKDENNTEIEPASRVHWLTAGFESEGDLSVCNTWVAPAEEVA